MLLVTVQSRPNSPEPVSENDRATVMNLDHGDLRISIRTGPLFGFRRKIGNWIVAGESCFPLKEDEIKSLEEGVLDGVPLDMLLGDRMLVLVLLDASERVATIAHSIASARPCYVGLAPGSLTVSTSVCGLQEAGHEVVWDPVCTPEYLLYRLVVPSRSVLRGIRKLAGGQVVVIDIEAGNIREARQWHWPQKKELTSTRISPATLARVLRNGYSASQMQAFS